MLRNRSRTKQSLMPDHNTVPTPKPNQTTSMSSFLGSPRFFNRFFSKGVTRNKQFSENKRIGLALINSLNNENSPDHKSLVQFGSKLKIHIPTLPIPATSPIHSSTNFGVNLHFSSPSSGLNSWVEAKESPNITTACLSWSEMELSEDYTCVISHGPNPKTTKIFDNCIVESCCGVVALSDLSSSPSQTSFLSSCHTCKKNLGEGKDIFMYRGEKAFCSNECRCEEMFLDEMDNCF